MRLLYSITGALNSEIVESIPPLFECIHVRTKLRVRISNLKI